MRSSRYGIYTLLIVMMSVLLFSCEQDTQITKEPEKSELLNSKDFSEMTEAELLEYFKNYDFGKMGSPPVSVEISGADFSSTPRPGIRSSQNCDVEITLSSRSSSSTDSATLEIYENDILVDSFKLYHTPKFLWEIDDANEYKYKIIPLGNTTNPEFYFQVGLKYGTKTVYPGITGVFTTPSKSYTCPVSTGGICDIEWEITKIAGSATSYQVILWPTSGPFTNYVEGTVYPGMPLNKTVNSNFAYDLLIVPNQIGAREYFRFTTSTPYLNVGLMFDLDMTIPNEHGYFPDFDYYDCP